MLKIIILLLALIQPKPYDVSVDATKLYDDYRADKTKADKLYRDKKIYLHGIVKEQSSNLWTVYLVIPDPEGLPARIDDGAITKVPLYKPGDHFDLVCVGAGLVFNLPLVFRCNPLN